MENTRWNTGQNDGKELVQIAENGIFHKNPLTFRAERWYTEFVRQAKRPAVFLFFRWGKLYPKFEQMVTKLTLFGLTL